SGDAPVDTAAEEQAWDEAMHQALSIARAEGKAPGGVEEPGRSAHASALDWRTLLRRYMTDAARRDYSWSVPNRRFIDSGLYLPSIRSEGIDTIAVIIDTSGSLPAQTLAGFWAELREIAAEIRPERVVVLQVDAALQDAAEYTADELPEEITLKGRGGTDFRPGFEWLDEQGMQPAVCLYFTDMECSRYPEAEPAFPVLWVDHSTPSSEANTQPWGERIAVGD
ncbi:MAG: VWA-like domain-containing protein, partial [Deltaproteobacteria bacterium]|nr:VWA-like domain-containing protein [Deltaproteobacteria bacterium]